VSFAKQFNDDPSKESTIGTIYNIFSAYVQSPLGSEEKISDGEEAKKV